MKIELNALDFSDYHLLIPTAQDIADGYKAYSNYLINRPSHTNSTSQAGFVAEYATARHYRTVKKQKVIRNSDMKGVDFLRKLKEETIESIDGKCSINEYHYEYSPNKWRWNYSWLIDTQVPRQYYALTVKYNNDFYYIGEIKGVDVFNNLDEPWSTINVKKSKKAIYFDRIKPYIY